MRFFKILSMVKTNFGRIFYFSLQDLLCMLARPVYIP